MQDSAHIMRLAPELHLAIVEMLEFPDNMMLKLSCRYFHKFVQPLSFAELEAGWRGKLHGWGKHFLPCDQCHRLRSKIRFEREEIFKRRWSCSECKVQKAREGYEVGNRIKVGHGMSRAGTGTRAADMPGVYFQMIHEVSTSPFLLLQANL